MPVFNALNVVIVLTVVIILGSGCSNGVIDQNDLNGQDDQFDQIQQLDQLQPASAEDLIGDWKVTAGDVEEVSLRPSGTYYTYLNDRPFETGTWTFASGTLEMISDAGEAMNKTFTNVMIQGDVLMLSETESWQRIHQE